MLQNFLSVISGRFFLKGNTVAVPQVIITFEFSDLKDVPFNNFCRDTASSPPTPLDLVVIRGFSESHNIDILASLDTQFDVPKKVQSDFVNGVDFSIVTTVSEKE